jgi:hypothetical protein
MVVAEVSFSQRQQLVLIESKGGWLDREGTVVTLYLPYTHTPPNVSRE